MNNPMLVVYAVALLLGVLGLVLLRAVMRDKDSPVDWWQFISSRGKDDKQYADLTKLGQATGIFLCVCVTFIFSLRKDVDVVGFCAVLGLVLTYLGGVQVFQTYMKARKTPPAAPPEEKT